MTRTQHADALLGRCSVLPIVIPASDGEDVTDKKDHLNGFHFPPLTCNQCAAASRAARTH